MHRGKRAPPTTAGPDEPRRPTPVALPWPPPPCGSWTSTAWSGCRASPSATWPAAIDALRGRGERVVFATNNSAPTTAELLTRLAPAGRHADGRRPGLLGRGGGLPARPRSVGPGAGRKGVLEALAARGVKIGGRRRVDAAVVGWSRSFDFDSLAATASAARRLGRLIGTNEDPVHPTPDGLVPGSGALLAAVATASGVDSGDRREAPRADGRPHEGGLRVRER